MSNDLVRKDTLLRTYGDLMNIADMLVKSKMLPTSINTKEAAAAIILKGRELGIPTMEAFALINVISGKPTISPQGMIALARRSGQLEDLTITDANDTCAVTVKRKGQSPVTTKFSARDADAMQLSNKDNWKKQPSVMRQWRAISANFRLTFPDVIGGMYMPEELGADVDTEGDFIPPTIVVEQPAPSAPAQAPTVVITTIPDAPAWEDLGTSQDAPKPELNIAPLPTPPSIPSHSNGDKTKRATVKTKRMPELVQKMISYAYAPADTKPESEFYHIATIAGKAGFESITDDNFDAVWQSLSKHFENKKDLQPA